MLSLQHPETLIYPSQAAALIGVKPETLAVWRCTRRVNLPFVKCGRSVRYRPSDIVRFIERNTVGSEK